MLEQIWPVILPNSRICSRRLRLHRPPPENGAWIPSAPSELRVWPPHKIAVNLPDDQIAEILALVAAGRAESISAFVKYAAGIALSDAAGWREMLDDALQQPGGPLTKKEQALRATALGNGSRPAAGGHRDGGHRRRRRRSRRVTN